MKPRLHYDKFLKIVAQMTVKYQSGKHHCHLLSHYHESNLTLSQRRDNNRTIALNLAYFFRKIIEKIDKRPTPNVNSRSGVS